MGSILEDILDANEFDEEFDSTSFIDIEQILKFEELDNDIDTLLPNISLTSECPVQLQSFEGTTKDKDGFICFPPEIVETIKEDVNSASSRYDLEELISLYDSRMTGYEKLTFPHSLKLAEGREQRMLAMYENLSQSILQVRKNNENETNLLSMFSLQQMDLITTQLKRNCSFDHNGPGKATCFCVCSKYIGIGTERGYVLLFDHKQEIKRVLSHPSISAVNMSEERMVNIFSGIFVTCLDCSDDGNTIIVGYKSGEAIFWDSLKGSILKQLSNDQGHFIHFKFVYYIDLDCSLENSCLAVVGLTSNHAVFRYKIGKSVLGLWHVETDCLLDDTAGKIISLDGLQPYALHMRRFHLNSEIFDVRKTSSPYQFIALSFPHQTNIIQLTPELKTIYKWKNGNDRNVCESIAWHWLNYNPSIVGNASSTGLSSCPAQMLPTLTRGKGNKVEILLLQPLIPLIQTKTVLEGNEKFVGTGSHSSSRNSALFRFASNFTSNVLAGGTTNSTFDEILFNFHPFFSATLDMENILSIQWLSTTKATLGIHSVDCGSFNNQLVVMGHHGFYILDHSLQVLEKVNFVSACCDTSNIMSLKLPQICVNLDEGFLLYSDALWSLTLRSPFFQANQLIGGGKWLEALSTIVQYVQKLSIDVKSGNGLNARLFLQSEKSILRRYILNYALLALKRHDYVHMTTVPSNTVSSTQLKFNPSTSMMLLNRHHHIQLVANVCIEYCIAIQQYSLLYEEIYPFFISEQAQSIFLEALEPFILNQQLHEIPSEVITDFVSYAISKSKYSMIEKTIIFLSPASLDIPAILRILYKHQMFSSLLYLASYGNNCDFVGATQAVMNFLKIRGSPIKQSMKENEPFDNDEIDLSHDVGNNDVTIMQADIGYKVLLYLFYCFELRHFPQGDFIYSKSSTCLLGRNDMKLKLTLLLQFLVSEWYQEIPSHVAAICQEFQQQSTIPKKEMWFTRQYPYLLYFATIDIAALFICLDRGVEQILMWESETIIDEQQCEETNTVANIIEIIFNIYNFAKFYQTTEHLKHNESSNAFTVRMFFNQFVHHILLLPGGILPEDLLASMMEYFVTFTSTFPAKMFEVEKRLQKLVQIQSKLSVIAAHNWFRALTKYRFFIASLGVNKSMTVCESSDPFVYCSKAEYANRIRFYVQIAQSQNIVEKSLNAEVFSPLNGLNSSISIICFEYIKEQYSLFPGEGDEGFENCTQENFEEVIIDNCFELMHISLLSTVEFILTSDLVQKIPSILQVLQSDHKLQYQFLTQLIHTYQEKHMNEEASNATIQEEEDNQDYFHNLGHKINYLLGEYLSTANMVTYIRLLAIFNRTRVFSFLVQYHEFCPIDESLIIAKEFEILDAMSFLQHRSGNRLVAIDLMCQDVMCKLKDARKEVDNFLKQEKVSSALANNGSDCSSNSTLHFISLLLSRGHFNTIANLGAESAASRNAQVSACMFELKDRIVACKHLERSILYLSDLCEINCRESDYVAESKSNNESGNNNEIEVEGKREYLIDHKEYYGKAFDHLLQLRRKFAFLLCFYESFKF